MKAQDLKTSAFFVDFENVYYSLLNTPFRLKSDAALTLTMDALSALRQELRDQGYALLVERSYADWERMPFTTQRQLQILGILPRFADSRMDKNTADIELSLDIMQHVLTRPELAHVILVGGDRDYLPILRRLKEQHRGIIICALKHSLSGDIREFAEHYSQAEIIELNRLVEMPDAPPQRAHYEMEDDELDWDEFNDDPKIGEWHERYLSSMLRFMTENNYKEIHLGPFFRWLQETRVFELVSVPQQRKVFEQLKRIGAVIIEERDTGQGYSFSVAVLNWGHELVERLAEEGEDIE